MQRLTNKDADRLANTLREAACHLAALAHSHNQRAAVMAAWDEKREANYWQRRADEVQYAAQELHELARNLRDRAPLWPGKPAP